MGFTHVKAWFLFFLLESLLELIPIHQLVLFEHGVNKVVILFRHSVQGLEHHHYWNLSEPHYFQTGKAMVWNMKIGRADG
jgi:hypothetical protein